MSGQTDIVLVLGSGPNAVAARDWPKADFDRIVAINNAWRLRDDWDDIVYPEDFPKDRRPANIPQDQRAIEAAAFVPAQNAFGGFVFAGGTMAFTAGYWALHALRPKVMAFLGCDMVYPTEGPTHYYGTGTADPLRDDISLRSLEAKSARLGLLAASQGCACVNLSQDESRLLFPRARLQDLRLITSPVAVAGIDALRADEDALGYAVPSGRYWEEESRFDTSALDQLDQRWCDLWDNTGIRFANEVAA
ncbi:MAG: hypothetical protein AB8B58_11000 [Roseobacter sp.]